MFNINYRRNKKYLILWAILLLVLLLFFNHSEYNLKRYHFLHFGTTIQITLGTGEISLSDTTVNKIDNLLKHLHYKWHPWRAGELQNLNNNLASLKAFQVSEEIIELIILTQKFYQISDGYFNPAIGKLINYYGFHSDNPAEHTQHITKNITNFNLTNYINNLPNPNNIIIKNNLLTNTNPELKLDVSGFIKADAMLKIRSILLNSNINNALINIGGDIYAMGYKDKNNHKNWSIAVNNINNNKNNIILNLKPNTSIATSGTYARYYKNNNKTTHHILNPRTGKSAQGFDQVTVINSDPYLADAAATALLIAGPNNYKTIVKKMGIKQYILAQYNKEPVIKIENKN